jgi:hypothetical protein
VHKASVIALLRPLKTSDELNISPVSQNAAEPSSPALDCFADQETRALVKAGDWVALIIRQSVKKQFAAKADSMKCLTLDEPCYGKRRAAENPCGFNF